MPLVSVVHDLTPWTNPEWHAARTLVGFVPLWERTAERAARLVCVSQSTAAELERRYPETVPRVRGVLNGVDSDLTPAPEGPAAETARRRFAPALRSILHPRPPAP